MRSTAELNESEECAGKFVSTKEAGAAINPHMECCLLEQIRHIMLETAFPKQTVQLHPTYISAA